MLIINLQTHATAGGCGVDLESTVSSSHLQEFRKLPTNTATRIAPRRAALSPCALQFRCFSACSREPRSAKRLLRLMLLLLSTGNGCSFLRTFDDEPRPAADLFSRQLTKRHRPVRLVVVASSSRKKKTATETAAVEILTDPCKRWCVQQTNTEKGQRAPLRFRRTCSTTTPVLSRVTSS